MNMKAYSRVRVWAAGLAVAGLALAMTPAGAGGLTVEVKDPGATTGRAVDLYGVSHALIVGAGATEVAKALEAHRFFIDIAETADADSVAAFLADEGADPDARILLWFAGQDMDPAVIAQAMDLAAARHVLAVFDTCAGGGLFLEPKIVPGPTYAWSATLPGRQILIGCDDGFTGKFLGAIDSDTPADANRDGIVSVSEIAAFLGGGTVRYAVSRHDLFAQGDLAFRAGPPPAQPETEATLDTGSIGYRLSRSATQAYSAPMPTPIMPSVAMAPEANTPGGGMALYAPSPTVAFKVAAPPPAPSMPRGLDTTVDRDQYQDTDPNPVRSVTDKPVSTFSIDVDTAAYANVRRFLGDGELPPRDAVRIEEMINYFDYDYPPPLERTAPFKTSVSVLPTPWNRDTRLLHIGIKGYDVVAEKRPRANLVFLLDVSGSMTDRDRLPLLKQAMRLLVQRLEDDDTVALVVYAGAAGTILEPTPGKERSKILAALEDLRAGGSTAGGEGIRRAYDLARRHFDAGAVNRVILATDGDFNVGIADPERLEDLIARQRDSGIYLSILGFGRGNLNDLLMQKLAQAGNGNAAYIDSLSEARKVLVDEAGSTLFPIAGDVKIQVEFNPARVAEYRLISYETRMLKREDFSNDAVDAGEIGSGHSVTALYEITPTGSPARLIEPLRYGEKTEGTATHGEEIAFVRLRYKMPGEKTSRLIEHPVTVDDVHSDIQAAPNGARFAAAVAGFAQLLRGDPYLKDFTFADVLSLAQSGRGPDRFGYRGEFVRLVRLAEIAEAQKSR
jgi:Ca-activated chloride channel homolog